MHSLPVTVITPTINRPSLNRCINSVKRQNGPAFYDHIIIEDSYKDGPGVIRNRAVATVTTPWVVFLDDDDYLYANCSTVIDDHLKNNIQPTGVIYTAWDVIGAPNPQPLLKFHPDLILSGYNHVPVTAFVRTDVFNAAGGFSSTDELEDMGLWQRIIKLNYTFNFIPISTWCYDRTNVNDSRNLRTLAEIRSAGCPTCGYKK
jgi:glycosyltransferase involved in cell wall biosynthesis